MISLHAHQGGQNGYEHSSPVTVGTTDWSMSQTNIDNSLKFATFLAARSKDSPAFLVLTLMNEPNPPVDHDVLLAYHAEAYKRIRVTGNNCILEVSPYLVYQGPGASTNMQSAPKYTNVWNEVHAYFIWGYDGKTEQWILSNFDTYREFELQKMPKENRLVIGEWCMGGPPDQNGIFQNMDNFRELGRKQLAMFNADATGGWAFWTWHSDETIKRTGWSMRKLIKDGDLVLQ